MSGPPYPPPLGGAGIGGFVIGQSAIGVGPGVPFSFWRTVISQYANSVILTKILDFFEQAIDPTPNIDAFFDNMWNIETAIGYGLDVWGRIVGVTRILQVASDENFGFAEADSVTLVGWNQAKFYSGSSLTSNYALTDSAFRTLIYAKAAANITDGSIPSINAILRTLFSGAGNSYVIDNNDMTITYRFEFTLSGVQRAIIEQSGVLPTPTGVSFNVVDGP